MSKIPQCAKTAFRGLGYRFEVFKASPEGGIEMTKVKVAIADDNRELLKQWSSIFKDMPK